MKFILDNWILIVLAAVSGGMLIWPSLKRGSGADSVGTTEAVMLMNREKAVVIDVREPDEFAGGHVARSKNVPLASLEGSSDLPSNKTLPIVVMCATGARSSRAAAILRKRGFERVVVAQGGLAGWREANLPVEK